MLKSWEDYSVALGDVVTIVSSSGKKIELSVVGTIDMSDTDYNGTYFFVPENILSEIYQEKKNFNTEFVINADVNQLPAAENVVLNAIGDNPDIQFNSFDDALIFHKNAHDRVSDSDLRVNCFYCNFRYYQPLQYLDDEPCIQTTRIWRIAIYWSIK